MQDVIAEIKSLNQVMSLGLELGLIITAIEQIQKEFPSLKEQKIKVIMYWIQRKEIIPKMQSSPPTWRQLADAVAEEDPALDNRIRSKFCQ